MLSRLGLPDVRHHRRFVAAVGVDALGSGVFMPVSVLYFLNTTALTLPEVGLAMTVAGACGFPLILLMGSIVDRLGAKRIILVANLLQAAGFVGYLFATTFASVVVMIALVALGQVAFWASYSPMVAAIARPGEREKWVGFLGALRNLGFAIGGLVSGLAVSIGTPAAYHAVVIANAASYLVAFVLLAGLAAPPRADHAHHDRPGWSAVLRDRPYHVLVLSNVAYALCGISLNFAMPVYAIEMLGLPGWVGGAIFVLNTIMVAGGQGLVVRSMTGHRRHRVAQLGFAVYAAGFVVLALAGWVSGAVAIVAMFVGVAIYTLGELLGGPVITAAAIDAAPEHLRGRYFSLYQMSWNVAGIAAPVLFAALLALGRPHVWGLLVVISGIGIALMAAAARTLPSARAVVTNVAHEPDPQDAAVDA